jgi:hypothetical protein
MRRFFPVACCALLFVHTAFAVVHKEAQSNEPKKFYKSYRLLPHQKLISMNKEFRDVYLHSEFPISIRIGDCSSPNTVELHCSGDPADVFVTDQRKGPPTQNSERNLVQITFVED